MKKGKLKFHNRFKGYGIIKDIETGTEYNVSPSGMQDITLNDGDDVASDASFLGFLSLESSSLVSVSDEVNDLVVDDDDEDDVKEGKGGESKIEYIPA